MLKPMFPRACSHIGFLYHRLSKMPVSTCVLGFPQFSHEKPLAIYDKG